MPSMVCKTRALDLFFIYYAVQGLLIITDALLDYPALMKLHLTSWMLTLHKDRVKIKLILKTHVIYI